MTRTDAELALAYRAAADSLRTDADAYRAMAENTQPNPEYLMFARPLASHVAGLYRRMAEECLVTADLCDEAASSYERLVLEAAS